MPSPARPGQRPHFESSLVPSSWSTANMEKTIGTIEADSPRPAAMKNSRKSLRLKNPEEANTEVDAHVSQKEHRSKRPRTFKNIQKRWRHSNGLEHGWGGISGVDSIRFKPELITQYPETMLPCSNGRQSRANHIRDIRHCSSSSSPFASPPD